MRALDAERLDDPLALLLDLRAPLAPGLGDRLQELAPARQALAPDSGGKYVPA